MADEEKKEETQEEVQNETPEVKEEVKTEEESSRPEEKSKEEPKTEPKEEPKAKEAPEKEEPKEIDMSKLSKDALKVVEMVAKMSVLELAELVKVLEDKFGVSAAAPVAVAAGVAGNADANAEDEKSEFDINITAGGSNKIGLIKAIRVVTDLGLKEAKDMTESLPQVVREGVKKEEAQEIKKQLEEVGATVELK